MRKHSFILVRKRRLTPFIDDQISNFLFTFSVRLGIPNAKRKQEGFINLTINRNAKSLTVAIVRSPNEAVG